MRKLAYLLPGLCLLFAATAGAVPDEVVQSVLEETGHTGGVAVLVAAAYVTVKHWTHPFLPYADSLVNIILYQQECLSEPAVVRGEVERVLVPGGAAVIRTQGNGQLIALFKGLKTIGDGYLLYIKPAGKDTDDWSHWLHGADGNPVAADQVSGPPRRIQWAAAPRRCKSHDVGVSMTGMVTGGGRLFYIADDGPVGMQDRQTHGLESWMLFCRDAYNGVLLWAESAQHLAGHRRLLRHSP